MRHGRRGAFLFAQAWHGQIRYVPVIEAWRGLLKIRVIPTILVRSRSLVKGERFQSWRCVGDPLQAIRVHEMRGVDEVVVLFVDGLDAEYAKKIAEEIYAPLSIGGGIKSNADIRDLLAAGCDKVVINTAAFERPDFINEASQKFGSQCITISIDIYGDKVATHSGRHVTDMDVVKWAETCERRGAGEILLGDVRRDGTLAGLNIDSIQKVSEAINIPVIASGGARDAADMADAIMAGASAAAAGGLFIFTSETPQSVKLHMKERGIPVRL